MQVPFVSETGVQFFFSEKNVKENGKIEKTGA